VIGCNRSHIEREIKNGKIGSYFHVERSEVIVLITTQEIVNASILVTLTVSARLD